MSFKYGKDNTDKVVSVEVKDGYTQVFREDGERKEHYQVAYTPWILYPEPVGNNPIRLDGDLHYKYAAVFHNQIDYQRAKQSQRDKFVVYNDKEQFLIKSGVTYYKGMEPKDPSVLSFDIETTNLVPGKDSKVLLISNTYRKAGKVERKLFAYDDYESQKEMIDAWCNFVRQINPAIITGHNIFGFDLPYLHHCAGGKLPLGRGGECGVLAKMPRNSSKFRKDGSQSYDYKNVQIPGREIIDTFFLAIKSDIARRYPSYALKTIIEFEGLERQDRQHYDASQIHKDYLDPFKWEEIKKYAEHDADDALNLMDLLLPPYFYYAQMIPKSMQQIINSASGSQVNSFLVRAYVADKHSIPKPTEPERYKGGISFGNPGVYGHCYKVDVASLYPSIIRQYEVYDEVKDPKRYFLRMVSELTEQRLRHKQLARDTGERQYKDREQAEKILINSAYGFMGAPGLGFNSPRAAARVTALGRQILETGINFCNPKELKIVNADTDSFMFECNKPFSFDLFIKQLNAKFPDMIQWEDDGQYESVMVVKAKNYVLKPIDGDIIIKGSALKATMKEPALRRFIGGFIQLLLEGKTDDLTVFYDGYANLIDDLDSESISEWSSKKTVTKAVLSPQRTNEARVLEAIQKAKKVVQEGDKIHVYFKTQTELALPETFDGEYCKRTLYRKLFKTVEIFKPVIDISLFPNYALKRNQQKLQQVLGVCEDSGRGNAGLLDITSRLPRVAGGAS